MAEALRPACVSAHHIKIASRQVGANLGCNVGTFLVVSRLRPRFMFLPRSQPSLLHQLPAYPGPVPKSPSGGRKVRWLQIQAGVIASLGSLQPPNHEKAKAPAEWDRETEGSGVPRAEPGPRAADVSAGTKVCIECRHAKSMDDFQRVQGAGNVWSDACRACLAAVQARRAGRELHHLALTIEEAWENAKVCSHCTIRKEIRDFARNQSSKDGIRSWCRSCVSRNYHALPAKTPADTPQQCSCCNEVKAAIEFTPCKHNANGLTSTCNFCQRIYSRYRRSKLKATKVVIQTDEKVCKSCGHRKLASEFTRYTASPDGLTRSCKECRNAQYRRRNKEGRKIDKSEPAS